ncbi:uncharacterized protein BKA55DRAFT_681910 [Fusarium redolens]|uniref:Uncharacterized protein n=1 Tax=Fusarium redolens TaxID=48865 RepID=A0A9P9JK01_FUSRE|nr:uncharacterized protein BKA55DRAFT_681910 [Fusarium redolens]KAH7205130.1 hypothetical protein BKA55DRAFT_681910 [Fusarium redolens]
MRSPLFLPNLAAVSAGSPKLDRIFIANRGEICCRIISTYRLLGLTSITVYTDEDAGSLHVLEADEAIRIPPRDSSQGSPFLDIDLLLRLAKQAKADAVHPGYGYLSENTEFATAIREASIVFIGPTAQAISTLGNKRQSKEFLAKNGPGIPLIPGYSGTSQEVEELRHAADAIGYPLLLKASAGGGGKGIRIYIEAGKHVEVQIIGDQHGNVISLFERDCSVQRRHQKIIEEAPCSWLSEKMRKAMCDTAFNSRIQVEHPITEEVTGFDIVALQLFVASGGNLKTLPFDDMSITGHSIECRLYAEDPQRQFLPELGIIHAWRPADPSLVPHGRVRFETAVASGTNITMSFDPMIAKIIVWGPDRAHAIQGMISVLSHSLCVGLKTNQLFLQSCLLHPDFRNPAYTTSFIERRLEKLLKHPIRGPLEELRKHITAVPAAYLWNQAAASRRHDHHFGRIGTRFRNQDQDKANNFSHILTVDIQKPISTDVTFEQVVLSTWLPRQGQRNLEHRLHQIALDSILDKVRSGTEYEQGTSPKRLAAIYNSITNLKKADSLTKVPHVNIEIKSLGSTGNQTDVVLDLNNQRFRGTLVFPDGQIIDSPIANQQPHRILFHSSVLGTWIAFKSFDTLTYIESLRVSTVADAAADHSTVVLAPMPCKVLRLLQQTGDVVRAGQKVLVIESMKMEMTIAANGDGQLNYKVQEGQALAEGEIRTHEKSLNQAWMEYWDLGDVAWLELVLQ